MEGAVRRGHHHRAVHRLRRLRDRLPARRHRLRARRRAATSRSTSRRSSGSTTASTARRAAPPAPGPAPASGPGSPQADEHLFARVREPDELSGIYQDVLLTRAGDDMVHQMGQDGGLVSALLIWLLDKGYIDAALASYLDGDGSTWKAEPGVAATKEEVLRRRGQPLHVLRQHRSPSPRPSSGGSPSWPWSAWAARPRSPPVMWGRKVGKVAKPFIFNIGLLCSKTLRRRDLRGAVRGQVRAASEQTW